eukprot:4647190-Lingulodinium_polyedra.AAC.1
MSRPCPNGPAPGPWVPVARLSAEPGPLRPVGPGLAKPGRPSQGSVCSDSTGTVRPSTHRCGGAMAG